MFFFMFLKALKQITIKKTNSVITNNWKDQGDALVRRCLQCHCSSCSSTTVSGFSQHKPLNGRRAEVLTCCMVFTHLQIDCIIIWLILSSISRDSTVSRHRCNGCMPVRAAFSFLGRAPASRAGIPGSRPARCDGVDPGGLHRRARLGHHQLKGRQWAHVLALHFNRFVNKSGMVTLKYDCRPTGSPTSLG